MRTLRASEIGSFLYCQRAWWYARSGLASENQVELADGLALHQRHGRSVVVNGCLQAVAYLLFLAALAFLAAALTRQVFG